MFCRFIAPTRRLLSLLPVLLLGSTAALLTPSPAAAGIIFWNSPTGGDFNTAANWSPTNVPDVADTAVFNSALSGNVTLSANATPGSISFDTAATSFALGTLGGNTITTANNGAISVLSTLTAANQTFTLNAPLVLTPDSASTAGAFTIQNNGTSASTTLVIAGGISSGATSATETLTLGGTNTGANLVSGVISNGGASALAVAKSGAGTWTLSGANTYTGGTSIAAGTLALSGGNNRLLSTGSLAFTGTSGTLDVGSTSQTLGGLSFTLMGTNSHVITGAGGTLNVTGGNIQIGTGDTTAASTSEIVDMSGLSNFSYVWTDGSFNVGGLTNVNLASITGSATLSLAATNTITASSFNVGSYTTGSNSLNNGTVHLGQTNTINATTFLVGNQKTTALLDFQNLVNPTLKIRGTGGTDTNRANITISQNNSGLTATNATMDLTSGGTVSSTLDAMVGTLMIGQNLRNTTSLGLAANGTFTMGLGTLNVTSVVIGQQATLTGTNTFSGAASGTLSLRGGTITATTFTLADKQSGAAAQLISSTFNLYSGTLNATTIQRGATGTGAGASTATINFNWVDGTLSNIAGSNQTVNGKTAVSGLTGGLNIVLNNNGNTSGTHTWNVSGTNTATVQDTVTLNGAGSLTKAGTGTLILTGASTYAGSTTITTGTLRFATQAALYNNNQSLWTANNLIVSTGATAAFNVGGAGEFTSADIGLLTTLGSTSGGFQSGSYLALDTTNAAGGTFTLAAPISNPNGGSNSLILVKQGTGTLVLTAASTHTGGTQIAQGTLALAGGSNRLPSNGVITFTGTTGTLDVGSTSQTIASLVFPTAGTSSHTITGAGGTLTVNSGNFQVGGGSTAAVSAAQTVDMSGLGNFVYTNPTGTFNVGGQADISNASITGNGVLTMAAVNTITASSFNVVAFSTGLSSVNSGTVHLGQTNTINASTILVGNQKTTAVLDFQNLVNPTLKIRGTGGTDADRAAWTLGPNASGVSPTVATVDLTSGGTVTSMLDAMVSTLAIGQNLRNNPSAGQPITATFTMSLGTLNAASIILGQQGALSGAGNTFSGNTTATLNLRGGTITATTFTLADKQSGAAVQTINSTFNLYSGTLEAGTIQRGAAGTGLGADTATINFNWVDGTISNIVGTNQTVNGNTAVNGFTGGLNIVLNNTGNTSGTHTWNVSGTQTATVQSTATLSGPGGLTKTGNGTLIFTSVNSHTGTTNVSAGELHLNATGGQSIAGNLTVNGGTARLLQANQINAASSLLVSSGTFALQTFNQTLANVQLTGGSITGTTGVLTSTNAYALQSGSVSAILAGTAGVVKSTGGTVILSGANTFFGGTLVSGGTLIGTSTTALGANSGLSIASGAGFAYRPTAAGTLTLGSGALTLAGGSTLGTAVGGTLSQSAITSSAAATASGAITVDIFVIPGASVTTGTHNLLTAASGLTSGGATYSLDTLYNATNFTLTGFQATDTALRINVASATALTAAFWKGGLGAGSNVWALSDGTASNWVTNADGTGATPLVPGSAAAITFSATGATNQNAMVLGANMSVRNIIVSDPAGITLNADGNTLTLANAAGIAVNSGAGAVTLNVPITLGVTQSWTNNSGSLLTIGGAVNIASFTLTVNGTGNTSISGSINGTSGVTKSGTGVLSLSGASTYTGGTTINAGTLNISAPLTVTSATASTISVAAAAGSSAILNILPGAALNVSASNSIVVGSGSGSAGAMNQSGGTVMLNGQINMGFGGTAAVPSYGFYNMSGGSLNDTGSSGVRFRIGGGGNGFMGVFYQTGGSINVNYVSGLEVGGNGTGNFTNATGIGYLTGGTFTAPANRIGYNSATNSTGGIRGEQTVDGTALITISGVTTLGQGAGDTGILNLNGGIYATRQIVRGNASSISIVNFDGGTLRAASSANATFLTGLTSANIYSGGATFDTNGQSLTIGQSLLAPAGNGVTTITVANGGSGYVGPPILAITGGGGTGATAVANMVDDGTGNGTFKIASITITSAGTGYTSAPTVEMIGGGGSGATLGTASTLANVSGGITKTGTGTLTLSGTNTYTGATVVNAGGTLAAGSTSAFGVDSAATVNGTLRLAGRNNALGSLAGTGIVDNNSATAATVTVGSDNTSTTFSGTLQDSAGGGALSLVKTGSGTQALSGTSTYTGTTTVSQGTLQVGVSGQGSLAAASAVSVNGATATLAGTGTVNGSVTVTSGFIQPGDAGGTSTGTLTVGSLNLTADGTGLFQIAGAGNFDHLTVLNPGGLTLDGKLVVTTALTGPAFDAAFAAGSSFDLLDWQGVTNNTFDVGANLRNGSADNGLQFDLPDISSLSLFWDVSQFLTAGTVVVVVPEPSRSLLFMLSLAALVARRRRAR